MIGEIQSADDHLFVFVDTNVFLHFTFFNLVDWCKELNVRAVTLILPRVVIEELDRHKWGTARRERERAKSVLRAIGALNLAAGPATLRERATIDTLDEEREAPFFAAHNLRRDSGDDRLLAAALAFKDDHPESRTAILSDDTGLALRGPCRKIEVIGPAEHLRLPDEPDETQRALEAARRELTAMKNVAPKPRLSFVEGAVLEREVRLAGPFEPDARQRLLAAWRGRHRLAQATPDSFLMPGGGHLNLQLLRSQPGFVSPDDARQHNQAVEDCFSRYSAYLDGWPAMVNGRRRCIGIELVLGNEGTAPADDIDLVLWTQAKGIWREERPKIAPPPAMRRARGPYDLFAAPYLPDVDLSGLRHRDDPIDGPNIDESNPVEAQFTVMRLKHHVPCALPKVYFQFAGDGDLTSFGIQYRMVAANIREPYEGSLNVRLTREAPALSSSDDLFRDDDDDE
jgi:hypothetical protein